MDPLKAYNRTRIPYGKPVAIPKDSNEMLLNDYGKVRAIVERGVVTIQVKKLKGDTREVARININATPPTIEFAIEETSG